MSKGVVTGTIFVTFRSNAADQTIEEHLYDLGLWGVRVSSVGRRWAVEVPPGKEQEMIQQLSQDFMVERVASSFLPGHIRQPKPPKPEKQEKRSKKGD